MKKCEEFDIGIVIKTNVVVINASDLFGKSENQK